MKKPCILFDTDIGGDCDDAGALALLHALCNRGEAELLAVTACYVSPYVAGCIDAINTFCGRRVPVGVLHAKSWPEPGVYAAPLCERFPNSYPAGCEVEDTVTVVRRTLAAAEDAGVTLVMTGPFSSAAALLASGPDDISPLDGLTLAEKKIGRTVVMGGRFASLWPMPLEVGNPGDRETREMYREWNIYADIPAAREFCDAWPGEIVFASYEIGNYMITLREFERAAYPDNPVAYAYRIHHPQGSGRQSWDLTAMLDAVRPGAGYWHYRPYGRVRVDERGVTEFVPGGTGRHTCLLPRMDYEDVRKVIDDLVMEGAKGGRGA